MIEIPEIPDEETYKHIINSPDYKIYKEVMDCVGRYMAQKRCRHERYEMMPYPARLGELADLIRLHNLREEGDYRKYLQLENEIDALPFVDRHPARQASHKDIAIRKMIEWLHKEILAVRAPNTVSKKDKLVISIIVWGDYVEKMINYTLKSLMAEGNLPTLVKMKHVIFHIQTDFSGRDAIEKSDIVWKIKSLGVHLQYVLIPDEIIKSIKDDTLTYWMLGAAASLGIQYARKAEAAYHHSYPDFVYSSRFFSELLRLSQYHKSILAPGHRADESQFLSSLAPYTTNDVISVPAPDLTALHMNHLHVNAWSCVVNNRPKNWHYPEKHVLIWESEDTLYFNCPHASILWLSYDVIRDIQPRYFMTLDSELDLICKENDFYIPQIQDDLYSVECSGQARSPVNDLWTKFEGYTKYFYSVITHRDSMKFFARGMACRINRKIRPLPKDHRLFNDQIAVEQTMLKNMLIANDLYDGIILGRPRWTDNRIFRM